MFENSNISTSKIADIVKKNPPMSYYFHNLRSSAKAGVEQFLTNGIRLSKGKPFSIIPPHDWGEEHQGDREWLVLRNAFFHVDWIFQAYLETDQPQYLYLAASNLVDWVSFNLYHNRPNRAKWSDICTGLRGFYFAFAIDRCSRLPSCHVFLPSLVDGAIAHGNELMRPEALAKSNHAIFQGLGLSALGSALKDIPEADGWLEAGTKILEDIIVAQYGREGVHLEHSPYYHGWVLQRLKRIADVGFFREESDFSKMVNLCSDNFVHFFRPDGSLSEVGDSSPENIAWASAMAPVLKYAASQGAQGEAPEQTDHLFHEAGFLIFRDSFENGLGKSHLLCHAGHHMVSHKHDDDLTIEWSEAGRSVLVDAGKLSYDHNDKRDYVISRRAHNVLQIDDGSGFNPRDAYGAATILGGETLGIKFAVLSLPNERLNCKQSRVLFLKHGYFLIVVDIIEAAEEHCYTQWFHFPPESEVKTNETSATVSIPGGEAALKIVVTPFYSEADISVVKGQDSPLQGWVSPDYGNLVPAPALGIKSRGKTVVLPSFFEVANPTDSSIIFEFSRRTGQILEIAFRWSAEHPVTYIRLDGAQLNVDGPISR